MYAGHFALCWADISDSVLYISDSVHSVVLPQCRKMHMGLPSWIFLLGYAPTLTPDFTVINAKGTFFPLFWIADVNVLKFLGTGKISGCCFVFSCFLHTWNHSDRSSGRDSVADGRGQCLVYSMSSVIKSGLMLTEC